MPARKLAALTGRRIEDDEALRLGTVIHRTFGALIVVFAAIALAEVGRPVRFVNLLLGAWLVAGPWFLDGGTMLARANSAAVGAATILLSLPLGRMRDRYWSWNRWAAWGPRGR